MVGSPTFVDVSEPENHLHITGITIAYQGMVFILEKLKNYTCDIFIKVHALILIYQSKEFHWLLSYTPLFWIWI